MQSHPFSRTLSLVRLPVSCLALVLGISVVASAAYDSPRFDRSIVEKDALSLSERDLDELATALSALVSNFNDRSMMDADLQEKSLAIALALNPLHPDARAAHARLMEGKRPESLDYFATLSSVSTVLWKHAERLASREAEPEDRRLAPKLMELALLIQPGEPPPEKQLAFQRAVEEAPLDWNQYLKLQPRDNASNARAIALFGKVEIKSGTGDPGDPGMIPKPPTPSPSDPPMTENSSSSPPSTPKPSDDVPVSEVQLTEATIAYVGLDGDSSQPIGGIAGLEIRDPTEDESSLFGLFTDTETRKTFEMRTTYDRDGPTISGLDLVEERIRANYAKWPQEKLAEFTFRGPAGGAIPGEINLSLPGLVLLGSAFSGEPINPAFGPAREFVLTGGLRVDGGVGMPRSPGLGEFAKAVATMSSPPQVLFVPGGGGTESQLLDVAIAGDLDILIRPQLVAFDSVQAARQIVFGETPAELAAAIEEYRQVQELTATMAVGNIARNEFVQDKLNSILDKWPQHLSARALLAYGSKSGQLTMSPEAALQAVQKAVKPVEDYYQGVIEGTGGGVVLDTDSMVNDALAELTELRNTIGVDQRPYLAAAERVLDAYKVYLALNNPDSSQGRQRHRNLLAEIAVFNQEQAKLRGGEDEDEEGSETSPSSSEEESPTTTPLD